MNKPDSERQQSNMCSHRQKTEILKKEKIKGFHTNRREKCRVEIMGGGRRRRNIWKVLGVQVDQVIL